MNAKERKALGRGFGALLKTADDTQAPTKESGILTLEIDEIRLNPKQPREHIDRARLEELAQSIKTKGIIHPILVRPVENGEKDYELVAGERRLRASRLAGLDTIPALIKNIKDEELLEIALIENIQRDNLNPIEESKAYRDLLEEHSYTQENLAKRVGKNRSTVANFIRLLQLPSAIQSDLSSYRLTTGHARALLSIGEGDKQLKLRDRIIAENLSVRETEEIVRSDKHPPPKRRDTPKSSLSSQMSLNQDRLREILGTKVSIKARGEKGKIEVEYYNVEDFNRIFALLSGGSLSGGGAGGLS